MELLLCVNILMLFMLAILNMALYARVTRSDRERKGHGRCCGGGSQTEPGHGRGL